MTHDKDTKTRLAQLIDRFLADVAALGEDYAGIAAGVSAREDVAMAQVKSAGAHDDEALMAAAAAAISGAQQFAPPDSFPEGVRKVRSEQIASHEVSADGTHEVPPEREAEDWKATVASMEEMTEILFSQWSDLSYLCVLFRAGTGPQFAAASAPSLRHFGQLLYLACRTVLDSGASADELRLLLDAVSEMIALDAESERGTFPDS